jgi:hypothetical protein
VACRYFDNEPELCPPDRCSFDAVGLTCQAHGKEAWSEGMNVCGRVRVVVTVCYDFTSPLLLLSSPSHTRRGSSLRQVYVVCWLLAFCILPV